MTVTSEASSVTYDGDDSTTAFPTDFTFKDAEDIVVTLTNSLGADAVQTLGSQYTVSGGDGEDGTVTMTTAPAADETLTLERTVSVTQDVEFREQGGFSPAVHENAFDKLTHAVQQVNRKLTTLETAVEFLDLLEAISDEEGLLELLESLAELLTTANAWAEAQTFSKGGVFTQATSNGRGVLATGNGTGAGVRATGGASANGIEGISGGGDGTGVSGTGGATNGVGVWGDGAGSGPGVKGVGGATGQGGTFTGGATSGNGVGGTGTAGGTGVSGQGGPTNGIGVWGTGAGTAPGVRGEGGTTGPGGLFPANAARGSLNLVPQAAHPSAPADGDIWIRDTGVASFLCVRLEGVTFRIDVTPD